MTFKTKTEESDLAIRWNITRKLVMKVGERIKKNSSSAERKCREIQKTTRNTLHGMEADSMLEKSNEPIRIVNKNSVLCRDDGL